MKMIPVIKENVKSLFFDFSLPIVVIVILLLNLYIGISQKIFTEPPTPFPYWMMYFFDSIILVLYSGYIGTKFFANEFDKNTMITLIATPLGKKGVYAGKIIADFAIIVLLAILVFLQVVIFFMVWGPVPYLFLYWYGLFTLTLLVSMLFSSFLAVIVGCIIKKTGLTLLTVSIYTIFSFFSLAFMPLSDYIVDNRIMYTLIFPSLGIWYMHLSISYYAIIYPTVTILGAFSTLLMFLTSYWVFMGVRV